MKAKISRQTPAAKVVAAPSSGSAPRFKVRCRYVLSWLESTKTFATRERAESELRKWKKDAQKSGYDLHGKIVKALNV